MIAYMPFTYLSRDQLEGITAGLGPLTLLAPAPELVPAHMRDFADRGLLELIGPQDVDSGQLVLAFEQFKQWAHTHSGSSGSLAEMATYFKTSTGRPPLVDETSPTQISSQIRHFGEMTKGHGSAPLFKAALFLAMAQDYDRHQDDMVQELSAVQRREQQMLEQLSGQGVDPDEPIALTAARPAVGAPDESGLFMTEFRIKAWAELAFADQCAAHLVLTSSRAVMAHIEELFPDAASLGAWDLAPGSDAAAAVADRRAAIVAMASDLRPNGDALAGRMAVAMEDCHTRLDLIALSGCPPRGLLRKLLSRGDAVGPDRSAAPGSTLIGLVSIR
jgi:hypothetical protein